MNANILLCGETAANILVTLAFAASLAYSFRPISTELSHHSRTLIYIKIGVHMQAK